MRDARKADRSEGRPGFALRLTEEPRGSERAALGSRLVGERLVGMSRAAGALHLLMSGAVRVGDGCGVSEAERSALGLGCVRGGVVEGGGCCAERMNGDGEEGAR